MLVPKTFACCRYAAGVRRLVILLLAAMLLALHHGLPTAMEHQGMAMGKGAMPASSGQMVMCIGVLAAAVALRRIGGRDVLRHPLAFLHGFVPGRPPLRLPDARDRPPPRPPTLAELCVNRR